LDDDVQEEYEKHISECERCRKDTHETRSMLAALKTLPQRETPCDCWAGIRHRIVKECKPTAWWRAFSLRPVIAAPLLAGAMLLALVMWPSAVHEPGGDFVSAREYGGYIGAHSHLQRVQPLADPDVTFVTAKLETADVPADSVQP